MSTNHRRRHARKYMGAVAVLFGAALAHGQAPGTARGDDRRFDVPDTVGSNHALLNKPTSRSVGRPCSALVATTEKPVLQPACDGLLEKGRL